MARIGLVLGAGGVVGQAYHTGVLTALEHECGWRAGDADVIVGTSAGSIVGALLRSGVRVSDLAAWTAKAPLDIDDERLLGLLPAELPDLERFRPRRLVGAIRRPHPTMVVHALRRPWQFRPVAAFLSLATPGPHDIAALLDTLRTVEDRGWPERDLWVCAVARRNGRRVVFGRDEEPDVPLHLAVAASCAVPGYFAPVQIGTRAYVDGGAHSPTNADLLRNRTDLDLVVVVAPMAAAGPLPGGFNGLLRRHSRRHLRNEVRMLRAAGLPVVVFAPGPVEQEAMGDDMLSREPVEDVVRTAYLGAMDRAGRPEIRERLAPLCTRPSGAATGTDA